jgi:hypothetical protein
MTLSALKLKSVCQKTNVFNKPSVHSCKPEFTGAKSTKFEYRALKDYRKTNERCAEQAS